MHFTKMQGLGNDYIYLDCRRAVPDHLPALAVRLSDRHFGVGGDGLICLCPSVKADFQMRIFNADGSEGEMCGNGIRCAAKYAWDKGLVDCKAMIVETLAGVKSVTITESAGRRASVTVDMGIPVAEGLKTLEIAGQTYQVHPVSMGNPHAVLFTDDIKELNLTAVGPLIERHPAFPRRVNVEFVAVESPTRLKMRVWERGSGETLACGTGACAALAAAVATGRAGREAAISLPGGELFLRWDREDEHMYMTGPAVTVFEGEWPDGPEGEERPDTKERGTST